MSITVNMDKAREIHKDNLRKIRAPLLAALDVKFMRAVETQDKETIEGVAAQKQALRDVTKDPIIQEAATTQELKNAIPDLLKGQM